MNKNNSDSRISKLVTTALMMCLVMIATMFIKLPIPFTQGYVHLGDAVIFLSVLILGKKYGAIAAGLGSALGDILGGFAFWAPWSLVIKLLMAFILGIFMEQKEKHGKGRFELGFSFYEITGMILACAEMAAGYYLAEGIMYGNWVVPLMGIFWNIGQFFVGVAIAYVLAAALFKTPLKNNL